MIADNIVKMIYDKMYKIQAERNDTPTLCVYIGEEIFLDMMGELNGQISANAMTLIDSYGKRIVGCQIYRVLGSHGIKIYEV